MDPISFVFGIISTTALALHTAHRTKDFIDGIQGAPRAVANLSRDLNALYIVLQVLHDHLTNLAKTQSRDHVDFIALLQGPLTNCVAVCDDVASTLRPFIKANGAVKTTRWRGLKWIYREKEIVVLRDVLASYKSSLELAIALANLYVYLVYSR
jgi:hypothetical protein